MTRLVALLTLALALVAVPAAGAAQRVPGCDSTRPLRLDVRAAAAVPGDHGAPLGTAAARRLAARLTGTLDVCAGRIPAATRRALRVASRRARHGDRRAFATLIRRLSRRRVAHRAARARAAAGGCPVGRGPAVKQDGRTQQLLATAAAAQRAGDQGAADAAVSAARESYSQWADDYEGSSVADDVAIAKGAMALGAEDAAGRALDRARTRAASDAAREQSRTPSPCTADSSAMSCALKAVAVAQLLGAAAEVDTASLSRMSHAIVDRIEGRLGPGCERWTFEMRMTTPADGKGLLEDFVILWGAARIDVDRVTGVVSGTRPDGADLWAMSVGSPKGRCYEETPDGSIDHGPVTSTGGLFHYRVSGSADANTMSLSVASPDATYTMTFAGDGDVFCQGLRDWGQGITNAFLQQPIDLPLDAAAGQTAVDLAESGLEIHLRRVL